MKPLSKTALEGALLGCAVGDALGLPYEGVSARRAVKLLGPPASHRFFFGHGMISDDTEHLCMTAQALITAPDDPERFARVLAGHLRRWMLALPAGMGFATMRSLARSWVGFSPDRSGVFSAGNGPAMRASIIGLCYGDDPQRLVDMIRRSTRITHSDPKATYGALAVALAAYLSAIRDHVTPQAFQAALEAMPEGAFDVTFLRLMYHTVRDLDQPLAQFMEAIGSYHGVGGYIYHTVPAAIHTWLNCQNDYETAVMTIIEAGGDTDTAAAILGAIIGARVGAEGIPATWRDKLFEWPRSTAWMSQLAEHLARGDGRVPRYPFWAVPGRNLLFLLIVLYHGLRRLLPPY